jgi:signal transduction histidine kinase
MNKKSEKNRIDEMIETIMNIAKGDYSVQIELSDKNNEFDSLAMGINMMIDDIRNSIEELERERDKVAEKSKELNDKVIRLQKIEAANLNIMEDLNETLMKLKNSQKKIKIQNIQLKKLDELKTAFLNVTSHELRTPMTTIKGYVQMLLKQGFGRLTEEQKKSLDVVLRNANRLDRLIEDILDVSRLQSGTMKFIPKITDIKIVVDETVESLCPYADFKRITIHADVEEGVPQLFIDEERIRQVLANLVNNAIKFSPDSSTINIKIKKDKKNLVLFDVQDHGRGIPKNKQKRVFNLFYQVDAGMDRKFGGAGLGLAISRGIVIAHGGRIWVESKEGEGSNFKFTLPVKPVKNLEQQFESLDMFSKEDQGGII